jgi:hypothetical protein
MTSPVAGLNTGLVFSGRTSTGWPSIQWDRIGSVAGGVSAALGLISVVTFVCLLAS